MNKIAIAIVHGVGNTTADFADEMIAELKSRFADQNPEIDPADALVFAPVYWGPILQIPEDKLWQRMQKGGPMDFTTLRRFMTSFAADALAYQPLPNERSVYDAIHEKYAEKLKQLATDAGATAPLVVISHSLGTIISSNYFYDLTKDHLIPAPVSNIHGDNPTPLEMGATLASFYTMGSPLALWSLRYADFGQPITVPAPTVPAAVAKAGGWYNMYDPDDIIGYPLHTLNAAYAAAKIKDMPLNAGGIFTSWNPMSHVEYWTDDDVTEPIAKTLSKLSRVINL